MSETEELRARFAATASLVAESEERRRAELSERVRRFVEPQGDERVLDAGTGTGALAFALAPFVREVVALDLVPELLAEAEKRSAAFPNVTFGEGDITRLPSAVGEFDLAGCLRTLHHVRRPELAVAELTRVTKPGGRVLLVDQLAPTDPLDALEVDRFERARDPTHTRALPDSDFNQLFEANGLRLLRSDFQPETRELDSYLDLAGCEGDARERAQSLAPGDESYSVTIGWYLLAR